MKTWEILLFNISFLTISPVSTLLKHFSKLASQAIEARVLIVDLDYFPHETQVLDAQVL